MPTQTTAQRTTVPRLQTPLLLAPRTLANNQLVAVLGALRSRLTRTFALREPAPDRARLLVTLRLATTSSVRVIAPAAEGQQE